MPRGPKGENRLADVIGNAIKMMRIVIGQENDGLTTAIGGVALRGEPQVRNMTSKHRT